MFRSGAELVCSLSSPSRMHDIKVIRVRQLRTVARPSGCRIETHLDACVEH